jgi:hypothetical protein
MLEIDGNTWVLLAVAVLTAVNTYYSRKTEKNTNSMKDALVETTRKVAGLEGEARGLAQGRAEEKVRKGEKR